MHQTGLEWAYEAGTVGLTIQLGVLAVVYVVLLAALFGWTLRSVVRIGLLRQQQVPRDLWWLGAMVLVAYGLRLLAPASPMDLHHRLQPAWTNGVVPAPYGWGFPMLARLLWSVFGRSDAVVFQANAVIGALTLVPLNGFAARLGLGKAARVWAVLLLATMPLHIRFSHTDNQSIVEIALFLTSLWAASCWAERPRWRMALLAGSTLGLATCQRPEAGIMVLVALAWLGFCDRPRRWCWPQFGAATVVLLAIAGLHVLGVVHQLRLHPVGPSQWTQFDLLRLLEEHVVILDLSCTWVAPAVVLGMAAGLLWGRLPLSRRLWLAIVALALSLYVWGFSPVHCGLICARHQLRALPFAALLAGAGLAGLGEVAFRTGSRRFMRAGRAALSGVLAATLLLTLRTAFERTTLNLEYAFFSQALGSVPPCCTVVTWFPPSDLGLMPQQHLSEALGADHRWIDLAELQHLQVQPQECLLYYRPASCFSFQLHDEVPQPMGDLHPLNHVCGHWESGRGLEPLWTRRLPARSSGTAWYGEGQLEVGFYLLGAPGTLLHETICWMDGRPAHEPRPPHHGSSQRGLLGCGEVFTPEQADALLQRVKALATGPCRLAGQRTERERVAVLWRDHRGHEVSVTLLPKACLARADEVDTEGGQVALLVPLETARCCPEAVEALRALVRQGQVPAPSKLGR